MSFSTLRNIFTDVATHVSDWMPWNRKYYPEWLRSMQGDSPLLSSAEYEYIAEVRHRIIREAHSRRPSFHTNQNLKHKLSRIKDNFEQVVLYLKDSKESKDYFVRTYPSWRKFRDLSIKQLRDIAIVINNDKQGAAATRGVGSSVSLVGGLMSLMPGLGAVRLAGCVLMGLGSLASAGISLLEFAMLKEKIKQAEKIMLEDKGYSEELWHWISDVSYIQEAYNHIKNVDVDNNIKKIAESLYLSFKMKSIPEDFKGFIAVALSSLQIPHELICEISEIIALLITLYMLHDRYKNSFTTAFEMYKCNQVLSTSCNVIVSAAKISSIVNVGKSAKLTNFQYTRIGIGIALDVLSIILAAEDMDSTSKESIEVVKAAKTLQEEAKIFEKLYNSVKNL